MNKKTLSDLLALGEGFTTELKRSDSTYLIGKEEIGVSRVSDHPITTYRERTRNSWY